MDRRGSWEPVPDLLMHHWLQLLGLILAWTSPALLCPNSPPSAQCSLPLAHYLVPSAQWWADLKSHRLSPSTEERFVPTVKDVQWCAPSAAWSDHQLHNNNPHTHTHTHIHTQCREPVVIGNLVSNKDGKTKPGVCVSLSLNALRASRGVTFKMKILTWQACRLFVTLSE